MKVVLSLFGLLFCFTQVSGAIRPGFFKISQRQMLVKPGTLIYLNYRVKNLDDETSLSECEPLRYFVQAPQGWTNLVPKKTNCLKPGESNDVRTLESVLATFIVPENTPSGDYIISAEVVRDARAMKRFAYDAVVVRVSRCGPIEDLKLEHVSENTATDVVTQTSTRVSFTAGVSACRYIVESSKNLTDWKVEEVFTSKVDGDLFSRSFDASAGAGDSSESRNSKSDQSIGKRFFRVRFFEPLR